MDNSIESKIDGVWTMKGMSTTFADRPPEYNQGASGQLIYDKKLRTVFAHVARPDDKSPTGELRFKYAGHFELSETQGNEITHHIEWATNPKMVGKPMKREFSLNAEGDRLSIIGPSAEYPSAKVNIEWAKLKQQ